MRQIGLLALRTVTGGLMAGHGAQKLFGAFDGPGLEGTAGYMESLDLEPPKPWAAVAGLSEFGGGVLTALGLLNPLGPIAMIAAMTVATVKAHLEKPIWSKDGGAELPLTYIAAATAIWFAGPGRLSLDRALGIRLPRPLLFLVAAAAAAGVLVALRPEIEETFPEQARSTATRHGSDDEAETARSGSSSHHAPRAEPSAAHRN